LPTRYDILPFLEVFGKLRLPLFIDLQYLVPHPNFLKVTNEFTFQKEFMRFLIPLLPPSFQLIDSHKSIAMSPISLLSNPLYPRIKPDFIIALKEKEFHYAVFAHVIIELKMDIPLHSTRFQDALNQITAYAERIFFSSRFLCRDKLIGILADVKGYIIIHFSFIRDKVVPLVFSKLDYSDLEPLCGTLSHQELSKVFIVPDSFLYNGKRTIGHSQVAAPLDGTNETPNFLTQVSADQSDSEHIMKKSKYESQSSSIYASSNSDLGNDVTDWTFSFDGTKLSFPYLIYASSLSYVVKDEYHVIKFSTYRAQEFIDFEILAYRRIQRYGVPYFACLEKYIRFDDSAALLFSTVGSSDLNNLVNFPLLVDSFESLHRVNLIHGDVRKENMICRGTSILLIDLAFARDYSSYSFTSIFAGIFQDCLNRASLRESLLRVFKSILKDIIAHGFLKDDMICLDTALLTSSDGQNIWPFVEKFKSFWDTRIRNNDVLELKNAVILHAYATNETSEDNALAVTHLCSKFDSALTQIRENFLAYFKSIPDAKLSKLEHSKKYPRASRYLLLEDEEYLETEVLCAINAAAAFESNQDERFRGLLATASNRILHFLNNRKQNFKLLREDDLESLVKTFCLLTYPASTSGILSGPQDDPLYILQCWEEFEKSHSNVQNLFAYARDLKYAELAAEFGDLIAT
jgi:hypothetical protein